VSMAPGVGLGDVGEDRRLEVVVEVVPGFRTGG
jgi:hypothetical protein